MSAALVKELLLDLAQHKLTIDTRSDLLTAIKRMYMSGVYTLKDIQILDLYLQGYTVEEIATQYNTFSNSIQELLERLFITIAEISGYNDDLIIQRAVYTYGHRPAKLEEFKHFLKLQGNHFSSHGIVSRG